MALTRDWKVLTVASVAVYLVSLDVTIVNIAFGDLAEDFPGTAPTALAWVLSGYNIAFAACLLGGGRVADRFGRRRVFFAGLGVFAGGSLLCAAAPTAGLLVASRVVQALGGALIMPASLALVLTEFPLHRRSAAIGIWGAVGGIAAATGPSLGGVLIEAFGWRSAFVINPPLCLAAWLVGRRLLVESRDPDAAGVPDVLGIVMGTLAVALIALGIGQGDVWGYSSPRVIGVFAVAAVLVPLVVLRSAHHPTPIVDLTLFRERFFTVANASAFCISAGFFAMLFVNAQFLRTVWEYPVATAGLALTPGPLSAAVVAGPAGRMADRLEHRRVVFPGTLLFSLALVLMALTVPEQPDYWDRFFPITVLMGIGIGLTVPTLGSAANAFLPSARFAMGSAFSSTCRQIGAALGVAVAAAMLGGAAIGAGGGPGGSAAARYDRAWFVLAASVLLGGTMMLALYRPPERREGGPPDQRPTGEILEGVP